jgi:hypothetical protein
VTVSGRVTTHRKASVHAPAPHNPVHTSNRGRKENAACMTRKKKKRKFA